MGSHVAQFVGYWTHNSRVVGSSVSCGRTSLGKMLTWTVLSPPWLLVGSSCVCLVLWLPPSMFPEGTETDNMCEKVLKSRPGCKYKVE